MTCTRNPLFLLAAALCLLPQPVPAQDGLAATARPGPAYSAEEAVKAGFLPKFPRYVSWPAARMPEGRAPFQLCVIGHDPFGRTLDQAAAAELIGGRGVTVRRLPGTEGAETCHVAYVRGAGPEETGRLLLALRDHAILTVTDARAGPQRGMIHFTVIRGRVRFFVDEVAAAARGLTISSRLLALAVGVRQRRS